MNEPACLGQKIWLNDEKPVDPEKRMFQSILIQAVKDYITSPEEKNNIRDWAENKLGTFKFCAMSMSMGTNELQKITLEKLDEIDNSGETKFSYSRA